jgi:hypothetical protein
VGLVDDSVSFLEGADILDDSRDLTMRHLRLCGHVSVGPVVLADAVLGCPEKCLIGMMPGIVDLMYERRPFTGAAGITAMTLSAISVERCLAKSCIAGKRRNNDISLRRVYAFFSKHPPCANNDTACNYCKHSICRKIFHHRLLPVAASENDTLELMNPSLHQSSLRALARMNRLVLHPH